MIASIQELLQKEAQAVLNIPVTDAYEKAVELIVEQVHRKKGKLVTSGMGKAGQIAMNIATTFCSTGIPSVFLHPSEAQHGDLGILQENDLLLLISNSGKTREIVELTQLAHNLNPKLNLSSLQEIRTVRWHRNRMYVSAQEVPRKSAYWA